MGNAGWYNDRDDAELARWHDGEQWTGHTIQKADWVGRSAPPPPAGPRTTSPHHSSARRPTPSTAQRRRAIVGSVAVLAVGGVLALVAMGGGGDAQQTNAERSQDSGLAPDPTSATEAEASTEPRALAELDSQRVCAVYGDELRATLSSSGLGLSTTERTQLAKFETAAENVDGIAQITCYFEVYNGPISSPGSVVGEANGVLGEDEPDGVLNSLCEYDGGGNPGIDPDLLSELEAHNGPVSGSSCTPNVDANIGGLRGTWTASVRSGGSDRMRTEIQNLDLESLLARWVIGIGFRPSS